MRSETLGELNFDKDLEVFKSAIVNVPVLGNSECVFVFDELTNESDSFPVKFEGAVRNFMSLSNSWLACLKEHLWSYYEDMSRELDAEDVPKISMEDILQFVEFGNDVMVTMDYDENDVYISLEASCEWEIEHGLQITLKNGNELAKVGPYDGHVTNADAYDREDFEGVIYVSIDML